MESCVLVPAAHQDKDLKRRPESLCYRVVNPSTRKGVVAEDVASPPLNVSCLYGMLGSGDFYGMREARALLSIFPRRLLWYYWRDGQPLQAKDVRCKICGRGCELKQVHAWDKYGVGDGCLFRAYAPELKCSG